MNAKEAAREERSKAMSAVSHIGGPRLTIDHGSISLACKPETIQVFVDRMIAAKIERLLDSATEPDKPAPRWTTSWPDWWDVSGNTEVVPACDYDALRVYTVALRDTLKWAMSQPGMIYAHRIKGQNDAFCDKIDAARKLLEAK